MPRVAMNGWTPSFVTTRPLTSPTARPTARQQPSPSGMSAGSPAIITDAVTADTLTT